VLSNKNMTQLVKALGLGDGDSTRIKLKQKIELYQIDISHYRSRVETPVELKKQRLREKGKRHGERTKAKRRNLEEQDRWIYVDSRRSDKKIGFENDLTREFIAATIKRGCDYCGELGLRMTLDRIDNSKGHLQTNVVPSCVRCNLVRGSMPYPAWLVVAKGMREARVNGLFDNWISNRVQDSSLTTPVSAESVDGPASAEC
jgi:5-methylcytosine-specific restriction endonuclease McrA